MEKNEFSRNRKSIQILAFFLFIGVVAALLSAQPTSIEEAKRTKIDTTIRVAQELIDRGMYQQAQVHLDSLQSAEEYKAYLSESHTQKIAALLSKINSAISQRERIAQVLAQSDQLMAEGKYPEAVNLLAGIQNSTYATAQEREMIEEAYNRAKAGSNQEQSKWQVLYEKSIQALNEGRTEEARQGFVQVAASGVQVQGQKSPEEYILSIDQGGTAGTTADAVSTEQEIEPMDLLPQPPAPQVSDQERSYLEVVRLRRAVQLDYTRAVVSDSIQQAENALAKQEFEKARQAIRQAFSAVESNKMLLEDALYKEYQSRLTNLEQQITEAQRIYEQQAEVIRQQEANQLTTEIRQSMAAQREEAVKNYMERTYAFIDELRFEEALGQLEQLLAIDPQNMQALMLKRSLEHNVRYIEQRQIMEEADRQELDLLMNAERASIPFSNEITYSKDWKGIVSRRDQMLKAGMDPADIAVNELLNRPVDLSMLTESTTFAEAIEMIRLSVDPPLTIIVYWKDLSDNALIEKDTEINMTGDGMQRVILRTALESLLEAISSGGYATVGYVVTEGVIKIATTDYLPTNFKTEIYDVSDLLNPPANFDQSSGGGMGGMGGGMGGGMMGGGMGGGMMGGGMMGGGMGGGMMGGGMGGGMMGGGMGGGMMGGGMMGGGMMGGVGNWQQMYRAYQLIYTIQQTIEPATWYEEGGEGRIDQFSESKLVIFQSPEIHTQIRELLDLLREGLGQQVAIETRFLLVDDNFLEDIGLDVDIITADIGGKWDIDPILQNSAAQTAPQASNNISSSLPGGTPFNEPALSSTITYNAIDDLQVSMILRATQAHSNSKQLSAPKAVVLNGESATMEVQTTRRIKSGSEFNTETLALGDGQSTTVYWWDVENEDIDSGVQLSITPVITADKKYVLLRVTTFINDLLATTDQQSIGFSPDGQVFTDTYQLPLTQETSIQTRVTVPDRGTVLMGGLTLTAERDIESGVPVLSKIPGLGRFFSNRSSVRDKQILLIMVKPTILLKEETEADAIAAMEQ